MGSGFSHHDKPEEGSGPTAPHQAAGERGEDTFSGCMIAVVTDHRRNELAIVEVIRIGAR